MHTAHGQVVQFFECPFITKGLVACFTCLLHVSSPLTMVPHVAGLCGNTLMLVMEFRVKCWWVRIRIYTDCWKPWNIREHTETHFSPNCFALVFLIHYANLGFLVYFLIRLIRNTTTQSPRTKWRTDSIWGKPAIVECNQNWHISDRLHFWYDIQL